MSAFEVSWQAEAKRSSALRRFNEQVRRFLLGGEVHLLGEAEGRLFLVCAEEANGLAVVASPGMPHHTVGWSAGGLRRMGARRCQPIPLKGAGIAAIFASNAASCSDFLAAGAAIFTAFLSSSSYP
jgi:hypothetical protein